MRQLGVDQVLCNPFTMILLNGIGAKDPNLMPVKEPVPGVNTYAFNSMTPEGEHAASYAKTFRIFYEEIKAANPQARVFIPFDMRWKATNAPLRYTVSDYLPKLNALLKDTEYGIAWHPYPVHFFTKPEFMEITKENPHVDAFYLKYDIPTSHWKSSYHLSVRDIFYPSK